MRLHAAYNANVRDFNTKLQVFPTNIFARNMGFSAKQLFAVEEGDKAVPEVKF